MYSSAQRSDWHAANGSERLAGNKGPLFCACPRAGRPPPPCNGARGRTQRLPSGDMSPRYHTWSSAVPDYTSCESPRLRGWSSTAKVAPVSSRDRSSSFDSKCAQTAGDSPSTSVHRDGVARRSLVRSQSQELTRCISREPGLVRNRTSGRLESDSQGERSSSFICGSPRAAYTERPSSLKKDFTLGCGSPRTPYCERSPSWTERQGERSSSFICTSPRTEHDAPQQSFVLRPLVRCQSEGRPFASFAKIGPEVVRTQSVERWSMPRHPSVDKRDSGFQERAPMRASQQRSPGRELLGTSQQQTFGREVPAHAVEVRLSRRSDTSESGTVKPAIDSVECERERNRQRLRDAMAMSKRAAARLKANPGVGLASKKIPNHRSREADSDILGLGGACAVQEEIVFSRPLAEGEEDGSESLIDWHASAVSAVAAFKNVARALSPDCVRRQSHPMRPA